MKNKKEVLKTSLKTSEERLIELLGDLNADSSPDAGLPICETEITFERIKAYADFHYNLKLKKYGTACYYAAAFFFLVMCSAIWTHEWLLTAIFAAVFFIFATLPGNLRTRNLNRLADAMERYSGEVLNTDFSDSGIVVTEYAPRENPNDKSPRKALNTAEYDYEKMSAAECVHSFYLFVENSPPIICDKTEFLRGTPMGLRDFLARKLGRRFKINNKKS